MPLYEFDIVRDGITIGKTEIPLPVNERDNPPAVPGATMVRRMPSRISVIGIESEQSKINNQMLRVCHRFEQRMGSTSEMYRRLGHAPETIKSAWSNDSPSEHVVHEDNNS